MQSNELEYVGFWPRVGAALIDTILYGIIIWPILTVFYGDSYWEPSEQLVKGPLDFFLTFAFPMVSVILLWTIRQDTPGKIAVSAKIVDAKTGNAPSIGQFILRYFSYYIAGLPLGIGIIWVAFDGRKQGWHDKLARTVVVRPKNRGPKPVSFNS